ncbi:hypothetical protein FC99_GL001945 [Levilactobacillus koreensis JCM 16448]|uniref:Uncharacterized protein n=1 Tax=Levilactobacillus koreensis TaxID=637971 RepID=A0AAC8ZGU5_9LACO|nr:hypothetical protein [Levilactobacillus koreensis]AKP65218.1 hypothetical protein ABN16_09515 [Levilactobacillus koreensis]KRK86195.1 hypothetical protein FC99_GL001945 [Levilactobacillus koreensis JCM 16448]
MESTQFQLDVNQRGAIVNLQNKQDDHHMNWVVDPAYLKQVGYQDEDKLFGEFTLTVGDKTYRSVDFEPNVLTTDDDITVSYMIAGLVIVETYRLVGKQVQWDIVVQNPTDDFITLENFGVWASLAYVMFRDKNVHRNMSDSAAVFPSISANFTKLAGVRRDNQGPNLGLFQTAGVTQSVGTYNEWTNRFFENVSPSLDGLLFHQLELAGGYRHGEETANDWIYPHNYVVITGGAAQSWSFVLEPFTTQADFKAVAAANGHPEINYDPLLTVGQTTNIHISLPAGVKPERMVMTYKTDGELHKEDVIGDYEGDVLKTPVKGVGEHNLRIYLTDGRSDLIVFNVMAAVRDLIETRVDWLTKNAYNGKTTKPYDAFTPISNQGESLGKLSLILQTNLLHQTDKTADQVREVEASAVNYVKPKWFTNGDFFKPVNLYGDFYRDMDFEYIGHVYYLLAQFDEDVLQLNSPATYLKWAAQVFNMRVNADLHTSQRGKEEAHTLGVYFLYINDLLAALKKHGLTEEYEQIKGCWEEATQRVAAHSGEYQAAITEHFYDNAGFGPATGALANAGYVKEARLYAELLKANIGYSNDFRSQAPDRWWEAQSYMIHSLWGGITAASALDAYEVLDDTALLLASYRAFVGVLYMYDSNATTPTNQLKPGEAASTYSIAGPNLNRPDLSRNRFGQSTFAKDGGIYTRLFPDGDTGQADWDMGEELAAYLTGFGQNAYLYEKDDGELAVVNGRLEQLSATQYRVTNNAPYPHAVKFIHRQQAVTTTATQVIYDTEKGFLDATVAE